MGACLKAKLKVRGLLGRLTLSGLPKDLQAETIEQLKGLEGMSYTDATDFSKTFAFIDDDGYYFHGVHEIIADALATYGFKVIKQRVALTPLAKCSWRVTQPSWDPRQQEAIDALLTKRRGAVQAPTGLGKTYVIAAVVAQLQVPALVIVHGADVVGQMEEAFHNFTTIQPGVVAGSKCYPRNVTVATSQKLQSMLRSHHSFWDDDGAASTFQAVIIDEAHHVAANGVMSVLEALQDLGTLKSVMAVSATYGRADDKKPLLTAYGGPAWVEIPLSEVVGERLAYLTVEYAKVPPKDYPEANAFREKKKNASEGPPKTMWQALNEERRTRNQGGKILREISKDYIDAGSTGRNKIIAQYVHRMRKRGKTGAIIVRHISHADALVKLIPGLTPLVKTEGSRVAKSSAAKAVWVKDQLYHRDQVDWVVTTTFEEAVNIPSLDCIVLAGGGKSWLKTEQRLRNTRICDENLRTGYYFKDRGFVLFFMDQAPMLEGHSILVRRTLRKYVKSNKLNEMKEWDGWEV